VIPAARNFSSGAAFQCFHVTHQKAVVGIGFGQYAVLALVLRQPVHQLGIFGIALQQAGMRMHIDQPRKYREAAFAVDDIGIRRHWRGAGVAKGLDTVLVEHNGSVAYATKAGITGIDSGIDDGGGGHAGHLGCHAVAQGYSCWNSGVISLHT